MTVEAWSLTPEYTIAGTGPYTITHPYATGAITASIMTDDGLVALGPAEFSVSPTSSEVNGNMTLSPTVATSYAGLPLIIDRITPDEQGWLAVQGEREAGLEAQLDRIVQSVQELRLRGLGALRIRGNLVAFDWADGTVPLLDGDRVVSGPTATEIAEAQTHATTASTKAGEAAASAAAALAKENSMLRDRGVWGTGILYSPSDIFSYDDGGGRRAYITQTAHLATTIAADLPAGRIRVFVDRGAPGAGTGDVLALNAGSEYTAVQATFRANVGLGDMAVKNSVAFSDMATSAVRTSAEGLASPTDSEIGTAGWVKALLDAQPARRQLLGPFATPSGTAVGVADLPDWCIHLNVLLDAVAISTLAVLLLRIGPSGGVETTGYSGGWTGAYANAVNQGSNSNGFGLRGQNSGALTGAFGLTKLTGNIWQHRGQVDRSDGLGSGTGAGMKTLAAALSRLELNRSAGNFSGGQFWVECLG